MFLVSLLTFYFYFLISLSLLAPIYHNKFLLCVNLLILIHEALSEKLQKINHERRLCSVFVLLNCSFLFFIAALTLKLLLFMFKTADTVYARPSSACHSCSSNISWQHLVLSV